MKKTVISLLLTVTFILPMSVSVFAGEYISPLNISRDAVEQAVSK